MSGRFGVLLRYLFLSCYLVGVMDPWEINVFLNLFGAVWSLYGRSLMLPFINIPSLACTHFCGCGGQPFWPYIFAATFLPYSLGQLYGRQYLNFVQFFQYIHFIYWNDGLVTFHRSSLVRRCQAAGGWGIQWPPHLCSIEWARSICNRIIWLGSRWWWPVFSFNYSEHLLLLVSDGRCICKIEKNIFLLMLG